MAVTLYRQVGKGETRRYQKVNPGRGRRPAHLTVPYFLLYSLADGTRPWEHVGDDLDEAIGAREREHAYIVALDANVPVVQDQGRNWADKNHGRCISMGSPSFNSFRKRSAGQEREDFVSVQPPTWVLPRLYCAEQPALPGPDRPQAASALREVLARA
jgi:hypothetical protein